MTITAHLRDETGEHVLATRTLEDSQSLGDFMTEAIERLDRTRKPGERRAIQVTIEVDG